MKLILKYLGYTLPFSLASFTVLLYLLSIRDFEKRHCRCFWRLFHHYIEENGSTTLDICKLSRVSTWFDRPWQSWQAGQVWVAWLFPRAKDVLSLLSFIAMWEEHGKYASVCGLDVGCCEKMYYNGSGFKSLGRDMIRPQIWHSTFKLFCLEEVFFWNQGVHGT